MSRRVPFIGVTCRGADDLPEEGELYRKAVAGAGGSSAFIDPAAAVEEISLYCDGFIIPGGRDPAPSLYREERRHSVELEDPQRIDFELRLLREIIALCKPVLGICYGMQLINIFFGGSLYQDIHGQVPGSLDHESGMHSIMVRDSLYMRRGEFLVNSRHHEAVKEIGDGLVDFVSAPDGIVEAFYLDKYDFLLGVQWHPERMQSAESALLFEKFVGACRDRQ